MFSSLLISFIDILIILKSFSNRLLLYFDVSNDPSLYIKKTQYIKECFMYNQIVELIRITF